MSNIHKLYQESQDPARFADLYFKYIRKLLGQLDGNAITAFTEELELARQHQRTVFFIGNGGSAATASHFANDLVKATRVDGRLGFRAMSLTDNIQLLTALANDYGYETVFTGQMRDLFKKEDLLVAISASGNSPNVVAAVKLAKERGGRTVGLVGFDGGALRALCDVVVHVQSEKGEYGPVEDIHLILEHLITGYLCMRLQEGQ